MYHFSTTTSFLLWHLWKEKNVLFSWGGILALIIRFFDFFLHVRQHQPWGIADLNKHDTRSSAGRSSRFVLFMMLFAVHLFWNVYAVMSCFFFFSFLVLRLERLYQWIVFLLCFYAFLFLARRHALIRDVPDDLYFSPPCFFFLQHKTEKEKKKEQLVLRLWYTWFILILCIHLSNLLSVHVII